MLDLEIQKNRIGPIKGRHPWVFSGAIKKIPDGLKSGQEVRLIDEQGNFLAYGYFNSYSQIAVRLWSWDASEIINQDFFEKRIRSAYEIRQKYVENSETDSYRLIYGENDLLPGLVVDKYADYLCVQFHNPGIEVWKDFIVKALVNIVEPKGIFERSDVKVRGIEKAEASVGVLHGDVPDKVKIKENGLEFWVEIKTGQKTGFFLDQRDKRLALQKYCKDKNVLNCFSYTGGFSVYALAAEAKQVVSVDSSGPALELLEENMKLNKFKEKDFETIQADVKVYLEDQPPGSFDVIILDPPAFVKDRHKVKEGLQGYRKINEQALRILPPGGILVTCSCSAHVTVTDFRYMLSEAAARAGRTVQILESYVHGIDHPELAAFTEGEYLKCFIAIVN
jgi:23S rRNA (cytosine1962-C5)-methyltransferase